MPTMTAPHAASDQHARKRLSQGDSDGGVALVVLESNVESRTVLLDQVVFEDQRSRLARNYDGFYVGNESLEQAVSRTVGRIIGEVTAHPAAEPLGLADIQDVPIPPLPQVHTGPLRKRVELPLESIW